MPALREAVNTLARGFTRTFLRFPLTVFCLVCAAGQMCCIISLHRTPPVVMEKLLYTFILGAFLGIAVQFCCERFEQLAQRRLMAYCLAVLLTVGYYLLIEPAPNVSFEVQVRTMVAVFALTCLFLWVPSWQDGFDFNRIALIHLVAAFTSVLFSVVLSIGCSAIIAAVDILLFKVNSDSYSYTLIIIWVIFATTYYLSLLPRFNSTDEADREYARSAGQYPKPLEILISYIAIPLVAVYTLVLVAYFVKILVTLRWPSGQLGPMVLAYSAVGLIIYVLASLLDNRPAVLYRRIFPIVLIPVVIMQLVSVYIRLAAYGVTESRYYVALFGLFSLLCAVLLVFRPVSRNGIIAVLAAVFAVISVLPPVDAFSISRTSQIARLEKMLQAEGILAGGKIKPKAEVSLNLRQEATSILSYLQERKYTKSIEWLPAGFDVYTDLQSTLGFKPAYRGAGQAELYNASLDMQKPIDISGYDAMMSIQAYEGQQPSIKFKVGQQAYRLQVRRLSPSEVRVSVIDAGGAELVGTEVYDFARSVAATASIPREGLPPEQMSFDVENNGYKMRIIFQNIDITEVNGQKTRANYSFMVMFDAP